ncbi:hypothetical protein M885DRAFT_579311 [Pelagophyceae sp. CCMP2097]|nr:hypothetical protein M885DRAFT_579311 [Pelagophyceae sp. CCMP2097]
MVEESKAEDVERVLVVDALVPARRSERADEPALSDEPDAIADPLAALAGPRAHVSPLAALAGPRAHVSSAGRAALWYCALVLTAADAPVRLQSHFYGRFTVLHLSVDDEDHKSGRDDATKKKRQDEDVAAHHAARLAEDDAAKKKRQDENAASHRAARLAEDDAAEKKRQDEDAAAHQAARLAEDAARTQARLEDEAARRRAARRARDDQEDQTTKEARLDPMSTVHLTHCAACAQEILDSRDILTFSTENKL